MPLRPWRVIDQYYGRCIGTYSTEERAREAAHEHGMVSLKVGKHAAGRLLDGQEWNETPWEV